ncbi:MAG TPA: type II toxin-antitoxin system VapC family toxin [Xanthobacteraceae bacterium]|nr:type II toxin-antitoxin system VapC family toxin [Xanthobacteraceae bacterium]
MIVLDTNVLSEPLRPTPSAKVLDWMRSQPNTVLFTTTITEAEFLYGIALLPKGKRRDLLESVVMRMFAVHLAGRILPFDSAAARDYADIAAARRRSGRPMSEPDARIAAIARSRGAELATRNVDDFAGCELEVLNPWL